MSLDPTIGKPTYLKKTLSSKIKEILKLNEEIGDLIIDCHRIDKDKIFIEEINKITSSTETIDYEANIIDDRIG